MRSEIISIGTELLLGHVVNTNAAFLGQRLAKKGVDVYHAVTVGDNPERLAEVIRKALSRSDIAITTGGLGPTVDDVTGAVIKAIAGADNIKLVENNVGTAAGLIAKINDRTIIALPGPPRELEPMFDNDVLPYLKKRYGLKAIIKSRTIKIAGLPESKVDSKARDLLNLKPPVTVGIYAKLGEVYLKIMAKARSERDVGRLIRPIEAKIRRRFGKYVFGCDNDTLEGAVGNALTKRKMTISVAESCTGGLLGHRLTNTKGSSAYFVGGVTAYSNDVKERLLGVSPATLKRDGAVSKSVALEMARGVRQLLNTDIGVGITGIAGPNGGTRSKPAGLVYIAIAMDGKTISCEMRFRGSREEVKFQATQAVLDLIRKNM